MPGGSFASLVDIDNAGRAVGGGNVSQSPDTTHAIFWSGTGSLRMLEPLSRHLYRDFAVARALDTRGNAVGASVAANGQIRGTVWQCAAAQTVVPAAAGMTNSPAATSVTIPVQVAR